MQKKLTIVTLIIALAAICLSVVCLVKPPAQAAQPAKDIQYVLYLGTNDKDTNAPVYPESEAIEKAKEILVRHFGGYTIQTAHGGWVGDNDTLYQEFTIVMYLSDTDLDAVHAAADEMVDTFHQSSVLIQQNETTTEFYEGK